MINGAFVMKPMRSVHQIKAIQIKNEIESDWSDSDSESVLNQIITQSNHRPIENIAWAIKTIANSSFDQIRMRYQW